MTLRTLGVVVLVFAATAGTADARGRSFGGKQYESNGSFGIGLELGSPFGLNGKYFVTGNQALNFGIGGDGYGYLDRSGFNLYFDYLWHPVSLADPPAFKLPFYIGIGGRIWFFDDHSRFADNGQAFGVRVPIGIAFDFNKAPIDVFIQLTPFFDFYRDYLVDSNHLGIEGSIGVRYWFD